MYRWQFIIAVMALFVFAAMGCSTGGNNNPLAPANSPNLTAGAQTATQASHENLWGYYDLYFDLQSHSVSAVPNHSAQFTANVVNFVNGSPANLLFNINGTPMGPNYVDVDIDVSIKHPFSGLPQYNGYDVRGVFVGNGSKTLAYDSNLVMAEASTDQTMLPDPIDGFGGPDGFTRWFNPVEFQIPGLFGYTPGLFANNAGSATLNPYKYFADGLGATGDVFDFLNTTSDDGVFSSGTLNTRNYYIRFPLPNPGVKYGYAILASWAGEAIHPARAPETQAVRANVTDNLFFVDSGNFGGNLILDIDVMDQGVISAGTDDINIFVESNVLASVHQLNAGEMIPTGGTDNFSTYHVEIPSDLITSTAGNDFMVIVEYPNFNYGNDYGEPQSTGGAPLAAFFKYDLFVANEPYNSAPVIDGLEDDIIGGGAYKSPVEITDTAVTYTVLFHDDDPGDTHTVTYYIVPSGNDPSSGDEVTMPIDWSTYATGDYDIVVDVFDGIDTTRGTFDIIRNTAPVVDSGVSGQIKPFIGATETYTITAHDPDGDGLTFAWTVTDASNNELISDDPGNGDGTIAINWLDLGAADLELFHIDCTVADAFDTDTATTLDVTATKYLLNYNAVTDGSGPMTVLANYVSNNVQKTWFYQSAATSWNEYTGTGAYPTSYVTILGTPAMNLPTAFTNVHVQFTHFGMCEWEWDGGMVVYTTNNGTTYTINGPAPGTQFMTYESGTNFNSTTNWYPADITSPAWNWNCSWMQTYPATGWANKYFTGGYGGGTTWGTQASPVTSTFTINSLKGTNNVQLGFLFISDWFSTSTVGWNIRSVKVWVD